MAAGNVLHRPRSVGHQGAGTGTGALLQPLRAISETSSLGVFATDLDGQINYANVNFQKLTARAASGARQILADAGRPEDFRLPKPSWLQALQTGNNLTLELRISWLARLAGYAWNGARQ